MAKDCSAGPKGAGKGKDKGKGKGKGQGQGGGKQQQQQNPSKQYWCGVHKYNATHTTKECYSASGGSAQGAQTATQDAKAAKKTLKKVEATTMKLLAAAQAAGSSSAGQQQAPAQQAAAPEVTKTGGGARVGTSDQYLQLLQSVGNLVIKKGQSGHGAIQAANSAWTLDSGASENIANQRKLESGERMVEKWEVPISEREGVATANGVVVGEEGLLLNIPELGEEVCIGLEFRRIY
jgi:hypothetical protein